MVERHSEYLKTETSDGPETAQCFAAWRVQATCIAHALKQRGYKRDSKRLSQILATLDLLWTIDLGDTYPNKLKQAIKAHNHDAHIAGNEEVQS
ncbi:MAG: hypothetical protein KUG56_07025 [Kordiimonadaceae bacterium]|nr:hypothetical protein [Kordiimonadaceae bacterium]